MREWIFASLLAIAGALIVIGVSTWSTGAGFCAAGVVVVGWSWLVFVYSDEDQPATPSKVPGYPVPTVGDE